MSAIMNIVGALPVSGSASRWTCHSIQSDDEPSVSTAAPNRVHTAIHVEGEVKVVGIRSLLIIHIQGGRSTTRPAACLKQVHGSKVLRNARRAQLRILTTQPILDARVSARAHVAHDRLAPTGIV